MFVSWADPATSARPAMPAGQKEPRPIKNFSATTGQRDARKTTHSATTRPARVSRQPVALQRTSHLAMPHITACYSSRYTMPCLLSAFRMQWPMLAIVITVVAVHQPRREVGRPSPSTVKICRTSHQQNQYQQHGEGSSPLPPSYHPPDRPPTVMSSDTTTEGVIATMYKDVQKCNDHHFGAWCTSTTAIIIVRPVRPAPRARAPKSTPSRRAVQAHSNKSAEGAISIRSPARAGADDEVAIKMMVGLCNIPSTPVAFYMRCGSIGQKPRFS